eukprot:3377784-Amphidinium_carterae.1
MRARRDQLFWVGLLASQLMHALPDARGEVSVYTPCRGCLLAQTLLRTCSTCSVYAEGHVANNNREKECVARASEPPISVFDDHLHVAPYVLAAKWVHGQEQHVEVMTGVLTCWKLHRHGMAEATLCRVHDFCARLIPHCQSSAGACACQLAKKRRNRTTE